MPLASANSPSLSNSSCFSSSRSRRDTTESTRALRHPRISSSSQSPPRGRVEIASRPGHGPVIQNKSGIMLFFYYLPRKPVDVFTALEQNHDPVMTVEDGPVKARLQRVSLPRKQR